jgi:hypothetical protein
MLDTLAVQIFTVRDPFDCLRSRYEFLLSKGL